MFYKLKYLKSFFFYFLIGYISQMTIFFENILRYQKYFQRHKILLKKNIISIKYSKTYYQVKSKE